MVSVICGVSYTVYVNYFLEHAVTYTGTGLWTSIEIRFDVPIQLHMPEICHQSATLATELARWAEVADGGYSRLDQEAHLQNKMLYEWCEREQGRARQGTVSNFQQMMGLFTQHEHEEGKAGSRSTGHASNIFQSDASRPSHQALSTIKTRIEEKRHCLCMPYAVTCVMGIESFVLYLARKHDPSDEHRS